VCVFLISCSGITRCFCDSLRNCYTEVDWFGITSGAMCETVSPAMASDVDAVPMADIAHRSPSNSSSVQTATVRDDADAVGGRSPTADDPAVETATAARHSKWGKLRQTVKATTLFASTVSGATAATSGSASTRGSRRKLESQADDRRDSFLKRFSTRQSSCGTSYLQAASTDGTSVSNSNLETDEKVPQKTNCTTIRVIYC